MEGYQSIYDGKQLDTFNAEVAFEEYDALIEKLKNSITYKLKLQLRETLSEKAELTAIETENIKREGKGSIWRWHQNHTLIVSTRMIFVWTISQKTSVAYDL